MNKLKTFVKKLVPEQYHTGLKQSVLKLIYSGNRYSCPVCQSNTRLQKALGYDLPVISEKQIVGGGLRMAMCPVCHSSERIRLLFLFLKLKTNLYTDPIRLLHFAPEPALQRIFEKKTNIQYLTADLYQDDVMEKIDITNITYPDNSFNAILCNHVLEHIPEDGLAMRELFRVLKPGGWAILQVPFSKILDATYEDPQVLTEKEREKNFGQKDHVRIYGRDYSERLSAAGFHVEVFDWTKDGEKEFQNPKINLNKDEVVYYCLK